MFVNGLPLAVIELKNPANEQIDIWDAFMSSHPLQGRSGRPVQTAAPRWSDQRRIHRRVGSLTADAERMLLWRTIANERPPAPADGAGDPRAALQIELFLDYVRHFVLFRTRRRHHRQRKSRATTSSTLCARQCAPR